MTKLRVKPLYWVASSLKDLRACPDDVQDVFGYALHLAQIGEKHPQAKPLKGYKGAGTLEIVEDHEGDTYRAVYTLEASDAIYVLHVFQKKAKRGIATPKRDLDLIESRLRSIIRPAKGAKDGKRRER